MFEVFSGSMGALYTFLIIGGVVVFHRPLIQVVAMIARPFYKRSKEKKQEKKLEEELAKTKSKDIYEFEKVKSKEKVNIEIKKAADFELNKSIIFKGKMTLVTENGKTIKETVYLYQPEYITTTGQKVSPYLQNGGVSDTNPYVSKLSGTGEVIRGYIPKREIVSGSTFDYVKGSKHYQYTQDKRLESFLSIEIPKDENGNYIPVDLTKKEELEALERYIEKRENQTVARRYFDSIFRVGLKSLYKFKDSTKVEAFDMTEKKETEIKTSEDKPSHYDEVLRERKAADILEDVRDYMDGPSRRR